jgi:hypothetical protein
MDPEPARALLPRAQRLLLDVGNERDVDPVDRVA